MKKFLALSMITTLVLVGCNSTPAPVATTTTPAATTAVEPAKATPAVVADEVIANPPKGCPAQTTLVATSKEAGTVKFMNKNSWYIEGNKSSPGFSTLHFVNYEGFDPANQYGHTNKGTDAALSVVLKTKDKSVIKNGVWKDDAGNNNLGDLSFATEASSRDLRDEKAQVELTYVGTDYVCGNIKASYNGSVSGDFIAKYSKQK